MAARSNGLPIPTHIPTEDSAKTEAVTNTGIIGLMAHRTLFIRLIIMSLEWIGTNEAYLITWIFCSIRRILVRKCCEFVYVELQIFVAQIFKLLFQVSLSSFSAIS